MQGFQSAAASQKDYTRSWPKLQEEQGRRVQTGPDERIPVRFLRVGI